MTLFNCISMLKHFKTCVHLGCFLCLWKQIGVAFYEMLLNADRYSSHLNYMDPICDFLYHMKYMFTGDSVKDQVSKQ